MPGIVGIVDRYDKVDIGSLLDRMCVSIKHEDWYLRDNYIEPPIAIGRVHLGIFNPEPQPIFNEDKKLCIFMNGEIYDYEYQKEKLRLNGHRFQIDNEPEFVLHLYEEYGLKFVEHLKGAFVVAIWDTKKEKLVIANDRYGLKPLYYTHFNGRLLFASEVKAILEAADFNRVVNKAAIADFFSFGYLFGNKTFFEGINLLPPSSIFVYQNGEITIKEYWDFNYLEEYPNKSENDYIEELSFLFRQAVNRQMLGNYRIGVSLSGGLDSRTIVAMIDGKYYPIDTHTFGLPGCDDARFAQVVADILGTNHHFHELKPEDMLNFFEKTVKLTDGMLNIFDSHALSKFDDIKEYSDVLLNGFSGDMILGSFLTKEIITANQKETFEIIYKSLGNIFEQQSSLFMQPNYEEIEELAKSSLSLAYQSASEKNNISSNIADYINLRNRQRRFILYGPITSYSIFEVRVPFYDYDLIDFVMCIPPNLRYDEYLYVEAFKKLFPQLAKVPWQKTGLPVNATKFQKWIHYNSSRISYRAKRVLEMLTGGAICRTHVSSFADYNAWIRTTFKDFVLQVLLDDKTSQRGYFNSDYLKQLVEEHMAGQANLSGLLGRLLTFELWHRQFVD